MVLKYVSYNHPDQKNKHSTHTHTHTHKHIHTHIHKHTRINIMYVNKYVLGGGGLGYVQSFLHLFMPLFTFLCVCVVFCCCFFAQLPCLHLYIAKFFFSLGVSVVYICTETKTCITLLYFPPSLPWLSPHTQTQTHTWHTLT